MAPAQWTRAFVVRHTLGTIKVKEELAALPMVVIRRSDTVLTPAATHFLDLLRRSPVLPDTKLFAGQGSEVRRRRKGPGISDA